MSLPKYSRYEAIEAKGINRKPEHWNASRLRFAATLNPSKQEAKGLGEQEMVSFLPMEAIGEDGSLRLEYEKELGECLSGYTYFRDGDVCVAKITPCFENGKGAILRGLKGGLGFGTTELIVARPREEMITAEFLDYLFRSQVFRSLGESEMYGAGGQKRVPDSFVRDFVALIPSTDEQKQVTNFLDRETAKIDALIAEQQRLIELLQEKRQAVISHAVTKGLNPNAPMKDSGVEWLGEVPEHWDVLPCRAFLNERDSRNGDYSNDYYLSLVAGRGVIPYDEKGDIGNKKPEDLGKCKLVQEGDFVINSMNYGIGSYGVSRFHGVCSPVYIVVTPNEDLAHAGFAFRVLENKWFQRYAQSFGNGILAHRCAISWDILKNINAGIPPAEEQAQILNYLDEETRRYEQLVATALKQVALLQERRSALISAAVTGQIDVRGLATGEEP